MKKENEGYEEKKPKVDPKEEDVATPESRLDALEKNVAKILKFVTKEDDEDEDKEKKKEDEEENESEDDKEKKKEQISEGKEGIGTKDVNPSPTGGDVKLPKAPAGENDETAGPEGDKGVKLVEKDIKKMINEGVQAKLVELGITKSTTPRAKHEQDIFKENNAKHKDFALDLLKRAKAGKLSIADMNRETKGFIKKNYESRLANIMKVVEE